ncbi:MAG: TetR/AcrR family transcriptional regulator [Sandaracinus sp.]|nr:TetR/AcrR family transcriptional regulator [Sandaracinus sp.]MCB9613898.1 TetR/AcrR family transcriptional regulator [Sandaracinus sp.]MCB9625343.1 TetR/AcrR family transcriptional regulator [Sandaracinus sp.]MCB9634134.1 TetR/AcrR family transcriptional regulator [Sandaracinus sp.]
MARSRKYDDEALLESLRATFLELGPGASSQELASRAGVSEGTLFKRFGTKRRLFAQAMRMPPIEEQVWVTTMLSRPGRGSVESNVTELATSFMTYLDEIIPVMSMIMASGKMKPADLRALYADDEGPPPSLVRDRFAEYFAAERALGRLGAVDASTLADFLLGACFKHVHIRHHFGDFAEAETIEQAARRYARAVASWGSSQTERKIGATP